MPTQTSFDGDLTLPGHWPQMLWLPVRGMPKKRPRVTSHGTFMPRRYVDWKEEVGAELVGGMSGQVDYPVELFVAFESDRTGVQLMPMPAAVRPKHLKRADIDNLVGGVMDAMQDAGVLADDRLVYQVNARVVG